MRPTKKLSPREAARLAEADASLHQSRPPVGLLDEIDELMADIDAVLSEVPVLMRFTQWEGE